MVLYLKRLCFISILFVIFQQSTAEICQSDENCQNNEYCGNSTESGGKICQRCFRCDDLNRGNRTSSQLRRCPHSIADCALCLAGYRMRITHEGYLDCSPDDSIDLLNSTLVYQSMEEENLKKGGMIAGAVVLSAIGVALAGFLGYTGVKYYKSKKQSKKKDKTEKGGVELQELQDVTTGQPEDRKDPAQSEELQTI